MMMNAAHPSQDGSGGRLQLLAPADLDDEQQKLYEAMTKTILPEAEASGFAARLPDGRFIGPFNAMLRVPKIAGAMGPWTAQIAQSGMADDVRHVVILAVGAAWEAGYEIAAHSSAARRVGVPQAAIDAIVRKQEPSPVAIPCDQTAPVKFSAGPRSLASSATLTIFMVTPPPVTRARPRASS